MRTGVLRVWKLVLVVGLGLTLLGTVGLLQSPPAAGLLWVTVVGWLVVPSTGLAYTGRHVDRSPLAYTVGAALGGLGAVVYVAGVVLGQPALLAGLTLAGLGQTAGIVAAVRDY